MYKKQQVNKSGFPFCGLGKKNQEKKWSERAVFLSVWQNKKKKVSYNFQLKLKYFETVWQTSTYKIKWFDMLKCYPTSKFRLK